MFEPLPAKFSFPEAELKVLDFWKKNEVFQKSLDLRRGCPRFVFYEGPPTANGLPHPGHCLTRAIKDLFPRYQTMRGRLVERKAGWDTHGLPVEVEVCKQLGIHTKEEIEQYGLEQFVKRCIESVFRYTREWEEMTDRLGFWINLDEAYVTYHQSYVESVWWSLKTLFDRGLLYQGHKVVWWWAQGGTALSAGEVGEGYREVDDPSVFVRFPLVREPNTALGAQEEPLASARSVVGSEGGSDIEKPHGLKSVAPQSNAPQPNPPHLQLPFDAKVSLLVWTTTPWTLISNHFAAVHKLYDYALVHDQTTDEYLYIATDLVETIAGKSKHKLERIATCRGSELIGLRYVPPFDSYHKTMGGTVAPLKEGGQAHVGWRVLAADFVTLDTGSGIVHQAPAYGEVDFNLLQEERQRFANIERDVPLINAVAPNGTFTDDAPAAYRGRWVKDCDKEIIRELKERGILYHQELVRHPYPFCPRAENDPLIQYARKSWFVRTSQFKDEFLANNDKVNWLPDHIKEGRFGDFLRNNVDWALSRERYWGTPLPIWVCEQTGKMEAIGSYAELLAKPGVQGTGVWDDAKKADPSLPDHLKVHKPYIDAITYDSPFADEEPRGLKSAALRARMRRVTEVIDCWWDAGSMPFAQWGFPHKKGSVETFCQRFPADFISEAIDQTRGWFYGLLAISTLMFGKGGAGVSPASQGGAGVSPAFQNKGGPGVSPSNIDANLTIRYRRKLPHLEAGGSTYFITFRTHSGELSPAERTIVLNACHHWDEVRMLHHAVVVMPDHVHLLMTPLEKTPGEWWSLSDLLHSIKSFSAHEINKQRQTKGTVWQDDRYDRIIRTEEDYDEKLAYMLENPTKVGLGDDYPWLWVEDTHSKKKDGGRDARPTLDLASLQQAYPHPYKTCIVLGHVMGEDGLKMSKRTKNYREPSYVFDHLGADAMRWYFFCAQSPWTSVRFQEVAIRDAQREFLIRLYNVFSFFNIYANIDGFSQNGGPQSSASPTGFRPIPQRSEIDRWIVSELHDTIRFVREHLDKFENYPAANRLKDFVDALSNWYVRRCRDRFWRSAKDQDKWDAYNTLYEVLVALSKLIAPFTPFFAETMYQNLCRGSRSANSESNGETPLSVHLCDYPEPDASLIDENLVHEMDLVRQIVSAGRAARTQAKLKVRQPLARVEIILAWRDYEDRIKTHADLIAEELNVKDVEFTHEADHYVAYKIKPNFAALGPKFGKLAPKVGAALNKHPDPVAARKALATDGSLSVAVEGRTVEITKDELDVRLEAKPGWSASQGRAGVVVVSTELTPELIDEGMVRELIHHVQGLRKTQDLAYEARIALHLAGPDEILRIADRFADIIRTECLAERIDHELPGEGEILDVKIESHEVKLAITQIS